VKLVIVESPNKTKKIAHYLGSDYEVLATAGHFRDLPEKELGVDLGSFDPHYVVHDDKKALLARIRQKATSASEVFLATDADREGEAISWHLAQALGLRNARRIRFQEITEKALRKAVSEAGPVDQKLVDAQQARRVLDRLVGYQVSPLLSVFGRHHSAGRVQSATLHLIVLREQEREAFRAQPYWTLAARYSNGLVAKAATLNDKGELVEVRFPSEQAAQAVIARAKGPHRVAQLETKPVERKPKPPFTTSTLQQAASVALRFKPDKTMRLAQTLFEGGHISYHRTDSVNLSEDAVAMARDFISKDYPEALPPAPPRYKGKDSAQEAHEAIRPTALDASTAELAGEERALYELIRARFLASQCKPAVLDQTTVTIESGDTSWRARGAVIRFPSFLRYLEQDEDAEAKKGEPPEPKLPPLTVGQVLELLGIDLKRQETKPPPRYTQASLISAMEKSGIGRPSTYAATVKTLFEREYIAEEKQFVYPTARGRLVDEVLCKAFGSLVETSYTADLELRLDQIAEGTRRWKDELRSWYGPFAQQLAHAPAVFASEARARPALAEGAPELPKPTGKKCPKCAAELMLRTGSKGAFLACSGYPKCSYTADPNAQASKLACPKCSGPMEELDGKFGRYARCLDRECGGKADLSPTADEKCPLCSGPMRDKGEFLSCAKYPGCRGSINKKALSKAKKAGKTCPKCGRLLMERKSQRGPFLGCSGYPACRYLEEKERKASRSA
jgi:DNA topoisomerase-1